MQLFLHRRAHHVQVSAYFVVLSNDLLLSFLHPVLRYLNPILLLPLVPLELSNEPFDFMDFCKLLVLILLVNDSLDAFKVLLAQFFLLDLGLLLDLLGFPLEFEIEVFCLPARQFIDVDPHLLKLFDLETVK